MRYVCPECGAGEDGPGPCAADGSERAAVGSDAVLGTTIGSWRVARVLGTGGMGRVYVAVQPQIGARVAIKVLRREAAANPDVVDRFFNEARAVNLIKHEAIVDVIDLGRLPDGAPYIVMEYLDGASLGALVRRDKRLPLGTLARIVGDVLAALEAAHGKGIIHRDLKPDNVFVSPSGRVTVLDFGVAKLAAAEGLAATQTGSLLGTPAYMSPEQARTQPLDARADLYAVGVMLYEAATGTLPFIAPNLFDLLQMHVKAAPRPPREIAPEIPPAFEAVILQALEKDPANRFSSAADMRRALHVAAEGLPQIALASIDIPATRMATPHEPSDPFARTAASTHASIATDETQASTPPRPAPAPTPELGRSGRRPRRTLFALLGGAALLGLGAAAVVMVVGNHGPKATRLQPPVDARPSLPEVPAPFDVTNPGAFDPIAYYKIVQPHAEKLGGKTTRLTVLRIHHMSRAGVVDLTKGGIVELIFASPERAKAGLECYLEYDFEEARGHFGLGQQAETDACTGGVGSPRCTASTIIERAIAKGMPAAATDITFNKLPSYWQVSSGDFSEPIDDDCE